jgi:hypothetical protein
MRSTSDNARTNGPIIDAIVHEIDAARNKVAGLVDEATRYENMGSPMADLHYIADHAIHGDLSLTGWREGLNQQGRDVMSNLEQKIATYAGSIAEEQPFTQSFANIEQAGGGGTSAVSASQWSGDSLPAMTGVGGFASSALVGADATARPPDFGLTTAAGYLGDPRNGDTLLASTPMLDPLTGLPVSGWPDGVGPGGSFVDAPGGRVLGPGGLIGAAVGPTAPVGLAGTAAATGSGMMPVVPPNTSGPGASGTTGAATKGPGKRHTRRRTVHSMFEVGQGGPAVILPSDEPDDHDPGPNVIGIDL